MFFERAKAGRPSRAQPTVAGPLPSEAHNLLCMEVGSAGPKLPLTVAGPLPRQALDRAVVTGWNALHQTCYVAAGGAVIFTQTCCMPLPWQALDRVHEAAPARERGAPPAPPVAPPSRPLIRPRTLHEFTEWRPLGLEGETRALSHTDSLQHTHSL